MVRKLIEPIWNGKKKALFPVLTDFIYFCFPSDKYYSFEGAAHFEARRD